MPGVAVCKTSLYFHCLICWVVSFAKKISFLINTAKFFLLLNFGFSQLEDVRLVKFEFIS